MSVGQHVRRITKENVTPTQIEYIKFYINSMQKSVRKHNKFTGLAKTKKLLLDVHRALYFDID